MFWTMKDLLIQRWSQATPSLLKSLSPVLANEHSLDSMQLGASTQIYFNISTGFNKLIRLRRVNSNF